MKNRQNSIDNMSEENKAWFLEAQKVINSKSQELYQEALARGVAKEQARFLLSLSTTTKMYMSGTLRSWIHYLDLRCANGTQKEHMDIANSIKAQLIPYMPHIAEACGWTDATPTV